MLICLFMKMEASIINSVLLPIGSCTSLRTERSYLSDGLNSGFANYKFKHVLRHRIGQRKV